MGKPTKHKTWKPASVLVALGPYKDGNFRYRWCNEQIPGNILKKQAEGWEFDTKVWPKVRDSGNWSLASLNDSKSLDNLFRMREMILMRMPKSMGEARDAYHDQLADNSEQAIKQEFIDKTTGPLGKRHGVIDREDRLIR
jgi:hypothetical protein